MNKEELEKFLDAIERVKQMIIAYESGKLALTKDQIRDMWLLHYELNNKCPHPTKMERHYISDYEDEYSSTHYYPECKIICMICNNTIKEGKQHMNGIVCAVTGENYYFDHIYRRYAEFSVLLDEKGQRTEIKTNYNRLKPLIGFWELAGPPTVVPPAPPAPPKKPEYLEKLEQLETSISGQKVVEIVK